MAYELLTASAIAFLATLALTPWWIKRARKKGLMGKVNDRKELTDGDYKLLGSILCGISSRKERINYFFIFGLSAVALFLAVYMDFFK